MKSSVVVLDEEMLGVKSVIVVKNLRLKLCSDPQTSERKNHKNDSWC